MCNAATFTVFGLCTNNAPGLGIITVVGDPEREGRGPSPRDKHACVLLGSTLLSFGGWGPPPAAGEVAMTAGVYLVLGGDMWQGFVMLRVGRCRIVANIVVVRGVDAIASPRCRGSRHRRAVMPWLAMSSYA